MEDFSAQLARRHIRCSLAAVIKNPIAKKSLGHQASSLLRVIGSTCVWLAAYLFIATANCATSSGSALTDVNPLAMPAVGDYGLRILSPNLLELTLINTKDKDAARVPNWDFVSDTFGLTLPAASSLVVTADSQPVSISSIGFKRRPIYAPVKERDLRIGNYLYIKLATAIPAGASVEVQNPTGALWTAPVRFVASNDPLRFNPAIHVNEVGYMPNAPKKAMVGHYLGNLGEMDVPASGGFKIVRASDGAVVFSGALILRTDVGYQYSPAPYQKVYEADFTSFTTPGEYRLQVPGMGASYAFMINEGVAGVFARSFALGMFHQRCGAELKFPFTRHEHEYCHTNLVQIPTMAEEFAFTQQAIASKTYDYALSQNGAPRILNTDSSLYPFVQQGKIDVSKGHHDAGDYSKYMINSAGVIHHLVFAADSFAGVGALDNLGIPESGDGKSDILQEAKWEADYVAKMQDSDGGFYFLVYPKTREYENDVTPDHGDTQVVWPKTTAVTAAATAALAEIASSPRFKQQFPTEAALYMSKAQLGWTFLVNAIAKYGKDGAYQKITHYGNEFGHNDELAWAASAMFAATGNATYLAKLKEWMPDPNSISVRRWDWWRMFEGWGCAIRTYSFAQRSGRVAASAMDAAYLAKCDAEIILAGDDIARFSQQTSYGMSFPELSKNAQTAGWNFASERGFDLTVAYQINPKPAYREAIFANINYEGGCNPVNVGFVTGIGWKRQRDIVQQQAQNDRQTLPPSGIPLGNIVRTFQGDLYFYGRELTLLSYPPDFPSDPNSGDQYAPYDRWGDSFNTTAEFVIVDVARSLGSLSFWMAQSGAATQPWRSATGQITNVPATLPVDATATIGFSAPGVDLTGAQIVWEVRYLEPNSGATLTFAPKYPGPTWVEAEALLPDGRRIFARTNLSATTSVTAVANSFESAPLTVAADMAALYHLDGTLKDAAARQGSLSLSGDATLDTSNLGWMTAPAGGALRVNDLGDRASVLIPATGLIASGLSYVTVEAMIYINEWKAYKRDHAQLLSLWQTDAARLELREDKYAGPMIWGGTTFAYQGDALKNALTLKKWHHISMRVDSTGYTVKLNGNVIASKASGELANWNPNAGPVVLKFGDFEGWVDEVVVRSSSATSIANKAPTISLLTSPAVLTAPATIFLTGDAVDPDGAISKVEFFNGATKLGEDTTAPFSYTLTNVAAGTYTFTARATDNRDAIVTSTPVTVTVNTSTGGGGTTVAATFVKTDSTTKGNWIGAYGAEGYTIIGNGQLVPTYGGATPSGKQDYTWALSTTDTRALQKVGGASRCVTVWYGVDAFNVDFNFTDNNPHRVALYVMDWDRTGRSERIDVLNAANNSVLATTQVSDFGEGKYVVWDLKGKTRIRVTRTAGANALIEGIFFDAAPKSKTGSLKVKGATAQGLQLEITGDTGVIYNIQSSADMNTWTNIGQLNLTTSPMTYTDTSASGHEGLRFYRVAP